MTFDSGFIDEIDAKIDEEKKKELKQKLNDNSYKSYKKKLKNIVKDIVSDKIIYYMCMGCSKILTQRQRQCPYCGSWTMRRFHGVDAVGYDPEQWIMLDEPNREKE